MFQAAGLFLFIQKVQIAICNHFPSWAYITGETGSSLAAEAVYTVSASDDKGYFTKIRASVTGDYTVLHVGTSNGKLLKVCFFVSYQVKSKSLLDTNSKVFLLLLDIVVV